MHMFTETDLELRGRHMHAGQNNKLSLVIESHNTINGIQLENVVGN